MRDRLLNISIVISASWHLICMFSIMPILVSSGIKENSTTISFLGAILEDIDAGEEKPFGFNTPIFVDKDFTLSDSKKETVQYLSDRITVPENISLRFPEATSKVIPPTINKEVFVFDEDITENRPYIPYYNNRLKSGIALKDSIIVGESINRMLLYKPEVPSYFNLSYGILGGYRSDWTLRVRFKLSRYGFVEMPECLISSGSFEIDQLALRYVRKWQFVPKYEGIKDFQEVVVRIRIGGE